MKNKVVTRFAPSPTGSLHTGGVRTALFNYLFAKKNEGKYILRIDDTDRERSTKEFEEGILTHLGQMNLAGDEIFHQSARLDIYQKYLQELLDRGVLYVSQETEIKEGQSPEVIRFKNPNKVVAFQDVVRGEVKMDTSDLGDFVVAKDLKTPLYHFASVVDDWQMGVTHIIRGEDHLSNTPRQILMWEALGAEIPTFIHLPLILAPDKSKLSKRKHAEIASIDELVKKGYLYEAILNFVALLGWNPGTDQEIFTLEELVKEFDISKIQTGAAVFNVEKLDWYNREYLKKMPAETFKIAISPYLESLKELPDYSEEKMEKLLPLILERITVFSDVGQMVEEKELQYFFSQPNYDKGLLKTQEFLPALIELIAAIQPENFESDKIKEAVWDFATEKGRGNVLWPMRVALSGLPKSPDPFTIAAILGKEETLKRLRDAQNL